MTYIYPHELRETDTEMQTRTQLSDLISRVARAVSEIEAIQETRGQGTGRLSPRMRSQSSWA